MQEAWAAREALLPGLPQNLFLCAQARVAGPLLHGLSGWVRATLAIPDSRGGRGSPLPAAPTPGNGHIQTWSWGRGPPACCCRPYPQGPSLCPHPLGRHMPPHTHCTCQGPMTGHPLHLPMGHSHGQGPRSRVPLQAPPTAPTSLGAQGGRAPTHPLSGGQRPAHTEQKQPQSKTQEIHTSYPGMPLHINSPPRCQETAAAPKLTEQETQERNEATPEPLPVTGTDLPEGGTMQPPSADSGFEGSS